MMFTIARDAARACALALMTITTLTVAGVPTAHAQPIKQVTVTLAAPTLAVGGSTKASVQARLANGRFASTAGTAWASSKPLVATVSTTGMVTTLAAGSATITATLKGVIGSAVLTVSGPTPPAPPPPPVATTITVTLAATSLPVGQTTQATAVPRDSSGDVVANRVVTWTSLTPGIATVTATGLVTAVSPGAAQLRATADLASVTVSLTVTSPPPAPVPNDTSAAATILAFAGPTIPASATPAAFRFYEDSARAELETQWAAFGPTWSAGNSISGYERAAIYYVWWARTGNAAYLDRAHQTAVNYRDNYLIPAGYATSPHWSQMESMYLDCLIAKDQKSCDVLPNVAYKLSGFPFNGYFQTSQGEPRIQARVIMAQWMNEKYTGQHSDILDSAIVTALKVTNADGWAPFQSTCGGSLNYMNGMLYDVLTRIHEQRPSALYNSLIETKAKAYGNWVWSTQWRGTANPSDKSFNYVSVVCDGTGSPTSAPDLNGLMLPLFGWLGKTTGDTTWFTRGDQVLAGMQQASVYLYRQFSESYSSSYRYLGYRWGK